MSVRSLTIVLFTAWLGAQAQNFGVPQNGYPTWRERAIIVLTNACRADPEGYRDAYVGAYPTILLESNYPATRPLYWQYDLNRSARFHAEEMANDCGLQHESCDGTAAGTRIASYYTKSPNWGENIATSRTTPQATMRQWLMDGDPPAADLNTAAGHRTNIMRGSFKEMGAGYAYGPVNYRYFWVQDFGGGTPDYTRKVVCGTHLFIDTGKTTFMANYFDSAGHQPPQSARVVVAGQTYDLALEQGVGWRGAYSTEQASGAACRGYYFLFTDANGTQFRYPEAGMLLTYGEGGCAEDYSAGSSPDRGVRASDRLSVKVRTEIAGNLLRLFVPAGVETPLETALIDGRGALVARTCWPSGLSGARSMEVPLARELTRGVYLIVHRGRDGGTLPGEELRMAPAR